MLVERGLRDSSGPPEQDSRGCREPRVLVVEKPGLQVQPDLQEQRGRPGLRGRGKRERVVRRVLPVI